MTIQEKLTIEIAALQSKYQATTGRNVYKIGAKIRNKQAILNQLNQSK